MVMWWVMFHEIIPNVLVSCFPIKQKSFLFYPVIHPIKLQGHCLRDFFLTVAVTMPLAAELYVFIGVGGWVKTTSWSVICRGTNVCPLWNSLTAYASTKDATTCFRILHSVWIEPFAGGRRFGDFSG